MQMQNTGGDPNVPEGGGSDMIKVYRASDILQRKAEKKARDASSNSKKYATRIWDFEPKEYELIRRGPMLPSDPDECIKSLQVATLTIFRNTDPSVEFAADRSRPMWKGVFRMDPRTGYSETQYYVPTQEHLKQIYATERPKKGQPLGNTIVGRDGSEMPYWVDEWQIVKDNEQRHKQTCKDKKAAAAAPTAAAPSSSSSKKRAKVNASTATTTTPQGGSVVPTDNQFIFPLQGWMQTQSTAKGASTAPIMRSTLLRSGPATELAKEIGIYMSHLSSGPAPAPAEEWVEEEEEKVVAAPSVQQTKRAAVADHQQQQQPSPQGPQGLTVMKLRACKAGFLAEAYASALRGSENSVSAQQCDPEALLSEFVKYLVDHY